MSRPGFRGPALLALALALALSQAGWAQVSPMDCGSASSKDTADRAYKVYSLADLGDDPGLGEWIAETIPEVIATGTWKGKGTIRYYAPRKILVVCHTPAVQTRVAAFLKDVKGALPAAKKGTAVAGKMSPHAHGVVPAAYQAPALLKAPGPAPEPAVGYPVPAQVKPPKHLFHFIIRYEGEGIIDDSVVKAMKAYLQAEKKPTESAAAAAVPAPVNPPDPLLTPPTAAKKKEEKKAEKKGKKKHKSKSEPLTSPSA